MDIDIKPEAAEYLNEIEGAKEKQMREMALFGAKTELLSHCNGFISKSESWRKASYEPKWTKYQRNADCIYDPDIAAKKEPWQSKVHVGITASHRETIHSHIFKTMCGVNPPLEISSRFDLGEMDQSENIRDIMLREMDKARWSVVIDSVMHDADTFGSGFIRMGHKTTIEKRKLRKEVSEQFTDNLNPMGMVGYMTRAATGKLKKRYEMAEEDVITYRGLELKHYSIWDIFPDPKALCIRGNTIACRYYSTYEQIVKGIEEGYYLEDAADKLKGIKETRRYGDGEDQIQNTRNVSDSTTDKTEYQQEYCLYELFGRMPKKWIYPIMGQEFENGEELVPARVIFHKNCVIAVEVNDDYEGEAPIYKLDYMPRNGSFYGVGVPEMLLDSQDVINEVVNQRLDNGAQALNHSFGVIEKALVNPKQDLVSKPGQIIRMDARYIPNGDVRNALTQLTINDTPVRAGFSEVNEAERWAQERTSANRVTLGTAGLVKDANQTLGGQQILRESAGEKFAYIGLRMEIDFLVDFFKGIWKVTYNNITPEDVEESIGEERAQSFILVNPEELSRDYVYRPMGVFTMENKSMRQAQLMQIRQQFLGAPWADDEKFFDAAFQNMDEDPDKFKKDEQQILMEQAQQIPMGGEPQTDLTGQPMPPSGPTGPIPTQATAGEAEMA
jgi:hypothetical protein